MAIYQVGADGKAPPGLKPGDQVVTGGGVYKVTGVNADGSYKSTQTSSASHQTYDAVTDYYNSYSSSQRPQQPVATPVAQTAPPAQLQGLPLGDLYGLTYDYDKILNILNQATQQQYAAQEQQFGQTENAFYNTLADSLYTNTEAMRQNNAAAVATGASTGMAAANELSMLLGLQQETTTGATQLANARNNLGVEREAALAENALTALDTETAVKQAIAGLDLTKYGYDTEGSIGYLSYLAQLAAAQAEIESATIASDATKYTVNAQGSSGSGSGGGNYGGGGSASGGSSPATPVVGREIRLGDNTILVKQSNGSYTHTDPSGNVTENVPEKYARLAQANNDSRYLSGENLAGIATGKVLGANVASGATVNYGGKSYKYNNGALYDTDYKPSAWEATYANPAQYGALAGKNLAELGATVQTGTKLTVDGKTYTYSATSGMWSYGGSSYSDTTVAQLLRRASSISLK